MMVSWVGRSGKGIDDSPFYFRFLFGLGRRQRLRGSHLTKAEYTPYCTMVFLACLTKVRRYTCDGARPLSQVLKW